MPVSIIVPKHSCNYFKPNKSDNRLITIKHYSPVNMRITKPQSNQLLIIGENHTCDKKAAKEHHDPKHGSRS
jgi:hypothetical protein